MKLKLYITEETDSKIRIYCKKLDTTIEFKKTEGLDRFVESFGSRERGLSQLFRNELFRELDFDIDNISRKRRWE